VRGRAPRCAPPEPGAEGRQGREVGRQLDAIAQRPGRRYILYADLGDATVGPRSIALTESLEDLSAALPANVVKLFARNANADDPRVASVPLGVSVRGAPRLADALAASPPFGWNGRRPATRSAQMSREA
jgi:hypothetical protein